LNTLEKLHFLHRAWRYRLRSERFSIRYMLGRLEEGDTVLDIGANRGIYTYWMSRAVGPSGRVIAFEPQPEMQEALRDTCETFSLDKVERVARGLSSEPGELRMRRPVNHWGGASFESREHECDMDEFQVPVTTLDAFAEEIGLEGVDLIKCDVEGHELAVFRGGEKLLTSQRPALLFECDEAADPECEVFRYLESIDYYGYCFHRGLAPVEQYRMLLPELDEKARKDFVFLG